MKTDYSNTNELIPEGKYEFIIKNVEIAVSKSGTPSIYIPVVIRNDIPSQGCQNKHVFHRIYPKKEPAKADMECSGYNAVQINTLCKAVGIPNDKHYNSLHDLFPDLKGGIFKAELYHDEFNGKTSEKIRYPDKSQFPECNHVWKDQQYKSTGTYTPNNQSYNRVIDDPKFEEISTDDDLPF